MLFDRIHRVTPAAGAVEPLHLHARYNRAEALTAFGVPSLRGTFGSGVYFVRDAAADLFFVTLLKTEAHFSPTTMYADAAISPTLFQWESQNATRADSPTGRRYRHHRDRGDLGAPVPPGVQGRGPRHGSLPLRGTDELPVPHG